MKRFHGLFRVFTFLTLVVILTAAAMAQTTTASIRGRVTDEGGAPVGGAEINAVSTTTGFVHTTTSRDDGSFLLAGLTPGNYTIVVSSPAFEPRSQDMTVLVGQTLNLTFRMTPAVVLTEEITVIGNVPVEMETHEITTNVTRQQIEQLPQNNRNFMNFAALAPGVTISDDEFRKTFQAGAQTANAVNVFVDGVSFKNDVLQGGVVGQDASRGNPFPQNAVQEFRVLTQNYSAEFQKASSAVVTAVTKSGSNALDGEVFVFYQDNDLVDDHPISGVPQTFFERMQTGLSIGGPIIRDRMHYFAGYEGNDQEREEAVVMGPAGPAALRQQLSVHQGVFPSEFELGLFFGKLSYQPGPTQLLDFSGFLRDETDVRGFGGGGRTSFEAAEEIVNDVWQLAARHQLTGMTWLNEASLSYQDFQWNPQPLNPNLVGRNYFDILRVGGRDTEQNFHQTRLSLRDDLTLSAFQWQGNHVLKVGGTVDFADYEVFKDFVGNPIFNFRSQDNWEFPFEALYGLGDPDLSGDNTQLGIYVQDEWSVTDHLLMSLGLRWDYETDMFPTDYVTPANVRAAFAGFVDPNLYFTDGNDRSAVDDMIAPRLGFAYDVFANSRTVIFGGWGRYYDRVLYNNTLDEAFRLQFSVGVFRFSRDGAPRDGQPTVIWQDRYLTEAGLQEVLAAGVTGRPEAFVIENDAKAPFSDQWNIGVRHAFGNVIASLSYGNTHSKDGFTFLRANRRPDGTCCENVSGFGFANLFKSSSDLQTWYDAIYLTLEKPFTSGSRWGGQLSYTFSDAEAQGGDLFSLDFPTVADYPRRPVNNVQDHRFVANALVRLPLNFNVGTVINYGSGLHYNIIDRSAGTGALERILRGEGEGSDYLTIDLRLEYGFQLGGVGIGLIGEAFNVTNDEVESAWENVIFTLPAVNPRFGEPTNVVAGSQRRFQYGVRLTF